MLIKPMLRILIVAALAALGLIGLVVRESVARAAGTEVLLAMEAVDPRSLLSGHYVIVGLAEALPVGAACPPGAGDTGVFLPAAMQSLRSGASWVALRPSRERHSLAGAADTRSGALALGALAVRGSASCALPVPASEGAPASPALARLYLGVDRFHINQSEAQRIDALLRAQAPGAEAKIYAIVSIGEDGQARLKGLMVEGERLELNWL